MFKVEVAKRVEAKETGGSWYYEENPALRRIIEWALGESLESFVHRLLVKTCKEIDKDEKEADNFWVRVIYHREPKFGSCFHRNRSESNAILPDILAGFTDDIPDFAMTIIHEALHVLRWDEEMIEKRSEEIYRIFEGRYNAKSPGQEN